MTKKIFTDSDGQTYELVESWLTGKLVIKPIKKAEEKQGYYLDFTRIGDKDGTILAKDYELTAPQAAAIADAIKALLEYIQNNGSYYNAYFNNEANKARKLIQEDSND